MDSRSIILILVLFSLIVLGMLGYLWFEQQEVSTLAEAIEQS